MNTENKQMTPEESLNILMQVAAKFNAPGSDHAIIRDALQVYENLIKSVRQNNSK